MSSRRGLAVPALGAVGVVLLYFAVTGYFAAAVLLGRGVETTGVVTEDVGGLTGLNGLAFTTRDGRRVETTSQVHALDAPEPGSDVRVVYDPRDPERAVEAGENLLVEPTSWLLGVGVVGYLIWAVSRDRAPREHRSRE